MGKTTDDNWAPFFVCGQVGAVLEEFSAMRPDLHLTVLCGHTHHDGVAKLSANLTVHTGAAEYGQPDLEGLLDIGPESVSVLKFSASDDA